MTKLKQEEGPKLVVLSGSSRFVDIMAVCAWLIEKNENAITVGLHLLPVWYPSCPDDHLAEHENVKTKMDNLHFKKIDLASEMFVVNHDDYIGNSTKREIEYALSKGLTIRWYTHDTVGEEVRGKIRSFLKANA